MSQSPERGTEASTGRDGGVQAHSCLLCKQRKVKCDKRFPCSACTRAHVQCIFKAPVPPRRGKRKPNDLSLLARLKRYEDMLQSLGVSIENVKVDNEQLQIKQESTHPDRILPPFSRIEPWAGNTGITGKLVAEEGKSLYFDNILWKTLSDELPDTNEVLNSSEDEDAADEAVSKDSPASPESSHDMILSLSSSTNIRIQHPLPSQIIRLWQIFVDAVNPLCKILHEPTTYASIIAATADLSNIPRNLEALMFSIYAVSIYTMEPQDCESLFVGEKRAVLVARYQLATRLALQRAGLLKTSDLSTLAAWIIYLFGIRSSVDPRVLWVYTGIAVRIAQRIGMHRDGSHLNISPFETEMRRRLWWQCVVLDSHASQLSGSGHGLSSDTWDTLLPLNINDDQISPEMTKPPQEQHGPTEMFFCMIRYEFGKVFRGSSKNFNGSQGLWNQPANLLQISISERDRLIDEAEKRINERWLCYADPFKDLHVLSLGVARTAISSMRFMVHHPRQYPDGGASLSQEEKDTLFQSAAKIIGYSRNAHISASLRKFRWHVVAFFQLNAFVYVLTVLTQRASGPEVDSTWTLVEDVYKSYPELTDGSKRTVTIALTNLTLKAWSNYTAGRDIERPAFITKMMTRKPSLAQRKSRAAEASLAEPSVAFSTPDAIPMMQYVRQGQQVSQGIGAASSQLSSPVSQSTSTVTHSANLGTPYVEYKEVVPTFENVPGNLFGGDPASLNLGTDSASIGIYGIQNDNMIMDWDAWDNLIQDSHLEGFDDTTLGFKFDS